jgi:hypothetical protein
MHVHDLSDINCTFCILMGGWTSVETKIISLTGLSCRLKSHRPIPSENCDAQFFEGKLRTNGENIIAVNLLWTAVLGNRLAYSHVVGLLNVTSISPM